MKCSPPFSACQADGQEPGVSVFTDLPIDLKAGGKPEVSPSESRKGAEQFLQLQGTLEGAPRPQLRSPQGLEEPTLPVDMEGEPAGAELSCISSGAWVVSRMQGNKNGEGRKNPKLVVNIKSIRVEVLRSEMYLGKDRLMQKSGSLERCVEQT